MADRPALGTAQHWRHDALLQWNSRQAQRALDLSSLLRAT